MAMLAEIRPQAEAPSLVGVDYTVIIAYFVAIAALGAWSIYRSRQASSRGFFVAEKALPWWIVGLTMVAASISAEQMLGEVGFARDAGLVTSNWDLGVFPALALMLFVFLPLYLRNGLTTIPEYLEKRYNPATRTLFAIYTVFNNAFITLVMVLALGAKALESFMGLPLWLGVLLLIMSSGIYTVLGGMLAVAWTQTLQCALLLAGGVVISVAGLARVPGGWDGLMTRMSEQNLDHLIRPVSDPSLPWPGLLLLMLSTNVWYCCTNQFYVQSCLGAKSERQGRLGVLLTAFLAPLLTFCFAFPGYLAADLANHGLLPKAEDANATYPLLALSLLGPGWRGFIVAAVMGAIMSTVSAVVNATSSVFVNDLYQRTAGRQASERRLIHVGRVVGLVTCLLAYPLTMVAFSYTYIFTYSQNTWCILAIPIMLVFTLGALWRRPTAQAAVAVFIFVAPFVAVPFIWTDSMVPLSGVAGKVHLFNFAFGLWIIAALVMITISLLTPRPSPAAIAPFVWRRGLTRSDAQTRWYQSVGFWSLVAAGMFVAIYLRFW